MIKWLAVVWIVSCVAGVASAAEDLDFHAPQTVAGAATAEAMRSLAERALPVYENPDRAEFLANLSALQMVAGEYAAADATRESLHEYREQQKTARTVDLAVIYDMYAAARARAKADGKPFADTFADAFHGVMNGLSDPDAFTLTEWLETPLSVYVGNLQRDLDRLRGKDRISLDEAVDLAWAYLSYQAFSSFGPFAGKLIAADDAKRYVVEDDTIAAPGRARISIVVVRPRRAAAPLPALLELTRDPDSRDQARECAAHGYAGVVAYPKPGGPGRPLSTGHASAGHVLIGHAPTASDLRARAGGDGRAVIEWIARQSWNDGRVGLYGSGRSALAAWEAASDPPQALAALAVSSVAMPASTARAVERRRRAARRRRRTHARGHSASIGFSALTTTGFFDTNEATSLAYFTAEHRRDPGARQWLLIGPYDSQAMERGTLPVLGGYSIDPVAIIDLRELRFQWFDHVLRGAPLPGLLADRVNFEVMGANAWRHAASLAAMANGSIRLYPNGQRTGDHYGLTGHEPSHGEVAESPVRLIPEAPSGTAGSSSASGVDSADDSDEDSGGAGEDITGIATPALETHDAVVFVSGPLYRPLEVSGRISGVLDFAAPLADPMVDLELYELSPSGEYFRFLSLPDASCGDCAARGGRRHDRRSGRRLIQRHVAFESGRLTSVELHTGSRIVLVLEASGDLPERGPSTRPSNRAGAHTRAGGHAGARTRAKRAAAKQAPAAVEWLGGSFVELPIWREADPRPGAP